ncbi:hypothetical protein H310_02645 [Aphanomyces invadans]|uniref:Uncharacterized protein n=1 Tax=Aphanomyces invadans TaxID=157072 RepID=A0A024UKJ3_9STRA|nr:hypothetical protein H310_02645 [Aphanomyces invadans]ETW06367.1 hypothetical protein H310_02645 [Aphanomyces invadans]|eukprot:XP_008864442.1 hypothetical protein H310_02645 [Aphanomyces invadans]
MLRLWSRRLSSICRVKVAWKLRTKRKRTAEEIEAAIRQVPHDRRQTLHSLAHACQIPKTTILNHIKDRSSYVKPFLTLANQGARLKFALNFVRPSSNGRQVFASMYEYVHADEKWFCLTKVKREFYVYEDEEVAKRAIKSKSHVTKVMLLAAIARPRFDHHAKKTFDGQGWYLAVS